MRQRSSRLLMCLALLAPLSGIAADTPRIDACGLTVPPADAGEMTFGPADMALQARVYPRLSQMTSDYTGCQVMWARINERVTKSVVRLRNGRVEDVEPKPLSPLCAPGERTIATGCSSRRESIQVSYPPGCMARRIGGEFPADCTRAFEDEVAALKGWPDD